MRSVGDLADGRTRLSSGFIEMWRGALALLEGRLDDAESHATAMLPLAARDPNFQNSWAALVFRIERERGRAPDLLGIVDTAIAATPGLLALRCVRAVAHLDAGRVEDARALLDELVLDGFAELPRDAIFSSALSELAEVCAVVGDVAAATTLRTLLLPYEGQLLVIAWGVACPGAADRFIGMLDAVTGHHDDAIARFASALTLEESVGGTALTARTKLWWARALLERRTDGDEVHARRLVESGLADARRLGLLSLERDLADVQRSLPDDESRSAIS